MNCMVNESCDCADADLSPSLVQTKAALKLARAEHARLAQDERVLSMLLLHRDLTLELLTSSALVR